MDRDEIDRLMKYAVMAPLECGNCGGPVRREECGGHITTACSVCHKTLHITTVDALEELERLAVAGLV